MARSITSSFQDVDGTEQADELIEYLAYGDALPALRQIKERSYDYLCLTEGDIVLDAGCGPGFDALRMAGRVGRSGSVVGIDISSRMIAYAQSAADRSGQPVSFRIGDVSKLDSPDASFDAVRIERTLQLLKNPCQVLDELVRVLRPGGRLVAIEPDWGTFVIDPGSTETVRSFFRFCSEQFADGATGRKLYHYFRERDLDDVAVHPEPLVIHDLETAARVINLDQFLAAAQDKGVLAREAAASWQQEMKSANDRGAFTFAGTIFTVSGRRRSALL
jgi:ubiquinone/menaquinone biosynthesis C-methylase UbiE